MVEDIKSYGYIQEHRPGTGEDNPWCQFLYKHNSSDTFII